MFCLYGNYIIELVLGELVSYLVGKGCMEELENIIWVFDEFFLLMGELVGKKVLIMVGLIYEKIDLVCFIGNYFFGKMGFVLVEECVCCGVDVVLIVGLV